MPKHLQTQRAFLFILTFLFSTNLIFGQADLVVSTANFQPNSIAKGDIFLIQATVTNIGNATAGQNYMFIYYTEDLEIEESEIISRVSIKELAPNESQDIDFIYPVPFLTAGSYHIGFEVDPFDDVIESDETNIFCAADNSGNCATFNITNAEADYQKFTYPIIFIHGLASESATWNTFVSETQQWYGWSFGGQLDYCLNPGNDDSSDTKSSIDFDLYDESDLGIADYYLMNFSDDDFNSPLVCSRSNQSAIVKQGWAVQDAVKKVLSVTGAEKVILIGHSMGGLAAREYIQNPNNWQIDGNHHVAKLLTVATPNGGSAVSFPILSSVISGVNETSEASRDLRYPVPFIFDGDYLFGGTEDLFATFYDNTDINCNGSGGDEIVGLNNKTMPLDIDYSCIFSNSDEVVDEDRADLNQYPIPQPPFQPIFSERFLVETNSFITHTNIHKENHATLISGIDEPDFLNLAYDVPVNSLNYGYSTEQADNNPIPVPNNTTDYDDFKIEITENGLLEIDIDNIPVNAAALFLLNENLELLEEAQSFGESNIGLEYEITPGTYYFEIASIPTSNSWSFPYAYSVIFTPEVELIADFSSNIQEGCKPFNVNFSNQSTGSPTEYTWTFQGGTPSTSTAQNPSVTYNEAGIYPVSLIISNDVGSTNITKNGFITVNSTPDAGFSFANVADNTVTFTNETQFDIALPNYSWDFGDSETSSEVSPTHIYDEDGIYAVELTATNGCGNSNTTKSVDIMTVGTNELNLKSTVLIYPNPSGGIFNVKVEGSNTGDYQLTLINNLGQVLKGEKVRKSGFSLEYQLDAAELPSGNYFLRIDSENENQVMRIVKK